MRTKKVLLCVLALMVALMAMSVPAFAAGNVAKIGTTEYANLDAAAMALQGNKNAQGTGKIVLLDDITLNGGYGSYVANFSYSDVTLDLAGHTITNTSTDKNSAVINLIRSNMTIIDSVGGGKLVGNANKDDTVNWWSTVYLQTGSTLTVEGGSIEANGTAPAVTFAAANQTVTVDGGDVDSIFLKNYADTVNVASGNVDTIEDLGTNTKASTINITGGTVGDIDVVETQVINDGNVAAVNGVRYATLEEALAAAPSGATVKLLADIDYSTTYTVRNARDKGNEHAIDLRDLTLDMNGHTISTINGTVEFGGDGATITNGTFDLVHKSTQGTYQAGTYALIIDNTPPLSYGATGTVSVEDVTINGGLNVKGATVTVDEVTAETTASKYYAVWAESDATVTINSGTFTDAQTGGKGVIATGQNEEGGAVLNITGGTFNASTKVVASAETDSIKISGGTFTKAVAEEYCADGFNPVDNGNGTYGVAPVAASVTITKKDAYVGYDGLGYLRYVSTVNVAAGNTVEYFGTWFIPEKLLADTTKKKATVKSYNTIENGKSFTADLLGIPHEALNRVIAGVSFVKVFGQDEVSTDVATATVEALKNDTSAE